MKNKKVVYIILLIVAVMLIVGVSYSIFTSKILGTNRVVINGDLYLKYSGSNVVTSSLIPMTKEEALSKNDNIFEFTVTGKNTSKKDLYYGISLINTGTISDEDIVVYLEEKVGTGENPKVLINGLRYKDLSKHVYVNYIGKENNTEVEKTYQLRIWLRDGIIVSDTESEADYTTSEWANAMMSVQVKVDGNLEKMNMPLSVESNNYVENNKQYIIASIKNYENPSEENELLESNDVMRLEVSADNTIFTYKDSLGNISESERNSLDLTYSLNKKTNVDVQIFVKPANDANSNQDILVKLTKNGDTVYEMIQNIDLSGSNYCLNNGFNKLNDCILVSENLSKSVSEAKTYINNKGNVNLNDTAPSYTYVENITTNVNNAYTGSDGRQWTFSDSYEFNSLTGIYSLTGEIIVDDLKSDYIGKYTIGTTNIQNDKAPSVYKILELDENNNMTLKKADKSTYKVAGSIRSEVGLYKTSDTQGDTYFYRGDVVNNNVYFGGYYWKIIRINGDSSIRLIYNGLTLNSDGNKMSGDNAAITNNSENLPQTYPFNQLDGGPTYVGYMYNEELEPWLTDTLISYSDFSLNSEYYFADDYDKYTDPISGNKMFKLKSTNYPIKLSKLSSLSNSDLLNTPYTCASTNSDYICTKLVKISSKTNNTSVKGYYLSYSPNTEDLSIVYQNNKDSSVKKELDLWYQNKFMNNQNNGRVVSDYIVDNTFCNDRSFPNDSGYTGYSLNSNTLFSGRIRLMDSDNKNISFNCNQNDRFSTTTAYGNAKLTYPIALITADEVALAGGKYNTKNENYYLRTNKHYYTMTPNSFNSSVFKARVNVVYHTGQIMSLSNVNLPNGIRAVINLSKDVLISQGDGSIEHPYELRLS